MTIVKRICVLALLVAFSLMLVSSYSTATLKYKRETAKKCSFCHSGIPKQGDEDPQLTEDGKVFKQNEHKLTEEQKKKKEPRAN